MENVDLIRLARAQHGAVTFAQLLDAGLRPNVVAARVEQGLLRRLHRGVYLVGALETDLTRPSAALLACGPNAALSHRTAAAIWDLLPHRQPTPSRSPSSMPNAGPARASRSTTQRRRRRGTYSGCA